MMGSEWDAVIAAAQAAWPDWEGLPTIESRRFPNIQAVVVGPNGEVDATALSAEDALAELALVITGTAPEVLRDIAAARESEMMRDHYQQMANDNEQERKYATGEMARPASEPSAQPQR